MTSAASLPPRALLPPLHVPQPGTPAGAEDLILPSANEEVLAPGTLPQPLGLGGKPPELEIERVEQAAERKDRAGARRAWAARRDAHRRVAPETWRRGPATWRSWPGPVGARTGSRSTRSAPEGPRPSAGRRRHRNRRRPGRPTPSRPQRLTKPRRAAGSSAVTPWASSRIAAATFTGA